MTDFVLPFNLGPLRELDTFAHLACQSYNYGNETNWFGCFRGGIHAVHERAGATRRHFYEVHAWESAHHLSKVESHLSSIFFAMDSAIECFTFGLNGLGNAISPSSFRDVTDRRALARVNKKDVLGNPHSKPPRLPQTGYAEYFPRLQQHWQANQELISVIVEQHAVSKHRQTIFSGGGLRDDPPQGFFEALGIGEDRASQILSTPMAKIILRSDPRSPPSERKPSPVE